ncbi:MAG: chromosome segregation protein SMC [Desulfobacterota bacterium]|nr:chromosome segregation protein SMC [Thermodesulfobacteriota bacterium]
MKLSRVEIRGFKSIAKMTSLTVSGGVTCIAGPNGCGKSNIIDALRWALGEQSAKSLRASAMNEVIFSGTQEVGPSSMASVTLEFEKDGGSFPKSLEGFEQVSITRRLFRSGESEYLINNVKCRLKDITDLFLDTGLHRNGYAIIEQGKVKDIIQSRPEEIRYLIEDAAEVGRFRIKRTEALRRLEATSRNLERINDLLGEVTKQRNDLKTQANKARRYQELRSEANAISWRTMVCELQDIAGLREAYKAELADVEGRMSHDEGLCAGLRERLSGLEAESGRSKAELEQLAARLSEAESAHLLAKREMEASHVRLGDIDATRAMLSQNLEESRRSISDEENRAVTFRIQQETIRKDIEEVQADLEALQAGFMSLEKEHESLEGLYNEKRTALFDVIAEARSLDQRAQEISGRQKEAVSTIRRRQQDLSVLAGNAEALSKDLAVLEAELSRLDQDRQPVRQDIETKAAAMDAARQSIESCTRAVIDLEKESTEVAAKITMLARIIGTEEQQDQGVARTSPNGARKVADTLSVKAGFESAVGRSMGNALDFLIFRDHEEILSLDDFRTRGPGFVIEQPHIGNHEMTAPTGSAGVLGELRDFIEPHEGYAEVVQALSQNMWVVDGLDTAVSLWEEGYRTCSFVTVDGMILEPTGVIRTTHEHTKYADVLKAKAEKKALTARRRTLGAELERQSVALNLAREDLTRLSAQSDAGMEALRKLEQEYAALTEKRRGILGQKERILEQQKAHETDLAQMQELSERLNSQAGSLAVRKGELEAERSQREEALRALDEQKLASKTGLSSSQREIQSIQDRLHELKVMAAGKEAVFKAMTENLEKINQAVGKDLVRLDELAVTRMTVEHAIQACSQEMARTQGVIGGLKADYNRGLPAFEKTVNLLNAAREETGNVRRRIDELERARSEILLKEKEQEVAHAMKLERMEGRFGPGDQEIPADFDIHQARQKVAELEERIERMGQINFASLEAFDHAQKRWEDLHRQYEDIVRASTRLKEVIASIERQSIKAFTSTFTLVRENFQEIFTAMFGGGKADLVIAEGDEMEAGIEIFASPPFKRLKAMSLLSEGEKTLCAISFIFALFKVNPSPFCILDEVDAPLDDANVIRLNRLIRSFSSESQFLIVTHNRHTMETADILYGVTFDVPGISKVVSMVLEEAQG